MTGGPEEVVGWCERCQEWKPLARYTPAKTRSTGLVVGDCGEHEDREPGT